ncbi:MAG: HAD family hydrolase [Arthrobacter sp.]|jgi:putative hydrolase of the HAD superfamily|nr:HAD family hydrolase [Arthrobacter sp.]
MPERSDTPTAPVSTGAVGVLFDLDDTLIDLRSAMREALLSAAAEDIEGLSKAEVEGFAEHFSLDTAGHYDAYVRGELDFATQRHRRLVAALSECGRSTRQDVAGFSTRFELEVVRGWRAFDDVAPTLDALDALGVPYGVVTNNVEAYQRTKLAKSGLERVGVVIGSDTAGAPKPDPRSYLAGVAALGTAPERTLMVGDNPGHDVAGAIAAGLPALLVDRWGRHPEHPGVAGLGAVLDWVRAATR